MKTYLAKLNDGGKSESFDTMDEAMDYVAKNFRTESDDLGTWNNDDETTLVWMTQDDADEADDNANAIATITERDA